MRPNSDLKWKHCNAAGLAVAITETRPRIRKYYNLLAHHYRPLL